MIVTERRLIAKKTDSIGVRSLIGNTGLIRMEKLFPENLIYGKMEMLNPAGSIKDRTSQFIIEESIHLGLINSETLIVESTSGNMGVGLAQICLYWGLKLKLIVDPYINKQTLQLLKAYGAEVEIIKVQDDSGSYLNGRIARVKEILETHPNAFWTRQYENPLNPLTHHLTIKEIVSQLESEPDYILVATSTCGTLMGFSDYAFQYLEKTKIIPVDSAGSIIFGGEPSKRLIPGFGASKAAHFLDESHLEMPQIIEEWESIVGCKKLLAREAILAGGSTGALVAAVEKMELEPDQSAVIIICDRGERYLDTIYSDDWIISNYGNQVFEKINQKVKDDLEEIGFRNSRY
ncbi:2,3-diaminopropionate biosynthesis protein SbnA [Pararhodonellum marinum]|uniref:2,3-diaminopropionate biosynthesis protein SbnA n=1 Tax=Pararhodonellum marinum TaxID=2755358 RepID=UPI00188FBECB|nr:2,3-diaminopropionate biosynthesis protein SbnA [Pararhodonellum marinum]